MPRYLWRLIIITSFGRHSQHPFRAAWIRLAIAGLSAFGLGILIGRSLASAPIPQGLPLSWAGGIIALASYVLVGFIGLSLGTGNRNVKQPALQRQLAVLPLSRSERWLTLVTPAGVVWILTLLFITPLAYYLGHIAQLPLWVVLGAAYIGSLSGLGATFLTWPRNLIAKGMLLASNGGAGLWLLEQAVRLASSHYRIMPIIGVYTIILAGYSGFEQSYRHVALPRSPGRSLKPVAALPLSWLSSWWFVLKLIRNHRSLVSTGFCLALIILMAIILVLRHIAGSGEITWLMTTGFLIGTVGCDVRGLTARFKAPEIETLRGPAYFVRSQVRGALALALLLPLPLLAVLLGAQPQAISLILGLYVGINLGAIMIGLLTSTLFVPCEGDVGGQFFAVILTAIILFGLPKLLHFSALSPPHLALAWLGVAIACFTAIIFLELNRRRLYGSF